MFQVLLRYKRLHIKQENPLHNRYIETVKLIIVFQSFAIVSIAGKRTVSENGKIITANNI